MDSNTGRKAKGLKRKAALNVAFSVKKERKASYKKISSILRKPLADRTEDDVETLGKYEDVVQLIMQRMALRQRIKDRTQEYEDDALVIREKCKLLAEALRTANHLVVYTGAGISTSARIPDYRGSNGIWTLLQQGKDIGLHDLTQAEPTTTHMALYSLYRKGVLKHIVSQNCDGLHLRSGLPRSVLSEVHGNMYIEVCTKCKPSYHYLRLFDVTEHTARYNHETLRLCYTCASPLKDTIVHFGERGSLQWPLNWETACKQADEADVILCLGSSLKVLKRYPWLWCMDKPAKKRPKLYIINLQWTPKDEQATLKINGKCDPVLEEVMNQLGVRIPGYTREKDPIFYHATVLHDLEVHTTTQPVLQEQRKDLKDKKDKKDDDKANLAEVDDAKEQVDEDTDEDEEEVETPEDLTVAKNSWEGSVAHTQALASQLLSAQISNFFRYNANPYSMFANSSQLWNSYFSLSYIVNNAANNFGLALPTLPWNLLMTDERLLNPTPIYKKPEIACSFCSVNFSSSSCLFYVRHKFNIPKTAQACLCCDSDEEEEEDSKQDDKQEGSDTKQQPKVPIVNPGWFGKGYRKKFKKKK